MQVFFSFFHLKLHSSCAILSKQTFKIKGFSSLSKYNFKFLPKFICSVLPFYFMDIPVKI